MTCYQKCSNTAKFIRIFFSISFSCCRTETAVRSNTIFKGLQFFCSGSISEGNIIKLYLMLADLQLTILSPKAIQRYFANGTWNSFWTPLVIQAFIKMVPDYFCTNASYKLTEFCKQLLSHWYNLCISCWKVLKMKLSNICFNYT